MLKKLLLSVSLAICLFQSLGLSPASAQWYNQSFPQWYSQVYDEGNPTEIFGERYTMAQVDWIIKAFITWPFTKVLTPPLTECFIQSAFAGGAELGTCINGVEERFGSTTPGVPLAKDGKKDSLLSLIFEDRSPSAVTMAKHTVSKFTVVPSAYAQTPGFGYSAFGGIINDMWVASRNIAYALAVLITIILSFMIMFRVKVSPQASITIQSALPKLLIALVLISFSYAIAGLLVDIMYVVIGLISIVLGPAVGLETTTMFSYLTSGPAGGGFLLYLVLYFILSISGFFLSIIALVGETSFVGGGILTVLMTAVSGLATILMAIVLFIALLFIWIKLSFLLLKTVATTFLLVIFAPIQIVIGVVAGGIGFSAWVKSLAAQLAVFPTVGVLFILSLVFAYQSVYISLADVSTDVGLIVGDSPLIDNLNTNAPPIGNGWPPLIGGTNDSAGLIFFGISLVLLFLIPKAADIIKGLISGRPYTYGSAIGEALNTPLGITSNIPGSATAKWEAAAKKDNLVPWDPSIAGRRGKIKYWGTKGLQETLRAGSKMRT